MSDNHHNHDHDHGHSHGHGHSHAHAVPSSDRNLVLAVIVNMALTVAQLVGGVVSGSLSLIADAMHNFSDALSLVIAFGARRIARRPSDDRMTFGYVRAEIVAALINYTTLIVVGLYLVIEAVQRFADPQPIAGWIVVIVAGIALVIDLVTAALTYAQSKNSMNIRAAFLHNIADAMGSVGVIIAGTLMLLFDWWLADPIVTLAIALYILWHAFSEIGGAIRLLMLGVPAGIDLPRLVADMKGAEGVQNVHHVHLWAIDEQRIALEAHVVVADDCGRGADAIRARLCELLAERAGIDHVTLQFEHASAACGPEAKTIGHELPQ